MSLSFDAIHELDQMNGIGFSSTPAVQKRQETGTCFENSQCLPSLDQQLLSPRAKCLSIFDATLFDSMLFMILRRVCFLYLERGWLRGDILILGQAGIEA